MLTPDIAERHLLSSIDSLEKYRVCMEFGLSDDHFTAHRPIWQFIAKYYDDYRQPPESELFEKKFPDFDRTSCLPIDPCIQEVLTLYAHRKVISYLKDRLGGKSSALNEDPIAFVRDTAKFLSNIEFEQTRNSHSIFDHNPSERLLRYYDKVETRQRTGIFGITTGLPTFDDVLNGWKPGELVSIIARLGLGKSWLLCYFVLHAFHTGKRVLFISPEMTKEQVEDRLESIYFYMLRGEHLQNSLLSSGRGINVSQYEEYLSQIKNEDRLHTYDSDLKRPFTVSRIEHLVETIRPDLVAIDGVPLLAADHRRGAAANWEDIKAIAYGLKNLAQTRKISIIAASWANRDTGMNGTSRAIDLTVHPTMEQISYSDAIGQASDVAITIALPKNVEERRSSRTLKMQKSRSTRCLDGLLSIDFDVDSGIIRERTVISEV